MKKAPLILPILVLLFVGCTTENTLDNTNIEGGKVVLTLSTRSTRTSLGKKEGDTYPVYWSEGDKIVVNGSISDEAIINDKSASTAQFTIENSIERPYHITYPYTEGCTKEAPRVTFPAEQHYIEGSFADGYAPMCGYSEKQGLIELSHLAGVLRLSIKASQENILLEKIVITSSSAKLAGDFFVDCTNGSITPSSDCGNSVTYILPQNFTLATNNENLFYITLPAVAQGRCTMEIFESSGDKMTLNWNSSNSISAGKVREFSSVTYQRGITDTLLPLQIDYDELQTEYRTIYGYVKDSSGEPIPGVAVSDGCTVVATNSNGYYTIDTSTDVYYIYISLPAEYEVPINKYGQPCFYKRYNKVNPRYDFTLTPIAGGKEEKFAIFALGDPQVSNDTRLARLNNEAVVGIKRHASEYTSKNIPCYGITLGDLVSNGSSDTGAYRDDIRDSFAASKTGMPVFQIMGNHDNTHFNSSLPINPDSNNSSFNIKAQRSHEDIFGPVNYSFNRGNIHIIGMRDIIYESNTTNGDIAGGFTIEQFEWLKQDLALVPKSQSIVLCVHIQLLNRNYNYIREVLTLLNEYKEAHVFSGHTHIINNYEHAAEGSSLTNIYEHNSGALCGAWWCSNLCSDGAPNGYQVFIVDSNNTNNKTFCDWYYIGFNNGMNKREHQMRLYRGDAVTGGDISGSNSYGIKGYYGFNFDSDILIANVYNADTRWTISVYEDGVYSGNMSKLPTPKISFDNLVGSYTMEDPRRLPSGTEASYDMYVQGLFLGILARYNANKPVGGSWGRCLHLYKYKLKNKDASIKVVATDRFGNVYTETKITEGTDYSLTKKP